MIISLLISILMFIISIFFDGFMYVANPEQAKEFYQMLKELVSEAIMVMLSGLFFGIFFRRILWMIRDMESDLEEMDATEGDVTVERFFNEVDDFILDDLLIGLLLDYEQFEMDQIEEETRDELLRGLLLEIDTSPLIKEYIPNDLTKDGDSSS